MPKKSCCCVGDDYCLTNQFVTIFGNLLDSAVPVSPGDLISLKINRPVSRTSSLELDFQQPNVPGVEPCPPCCTQCAIDACTDCPKLYICENDACKAASPGDLVPPYVPAAVEAVEFGGGCRECCASLCSNRCDPNIDPNCPTLKQTQNTHSDNATFNVSQMFKKLVNRGPKTPINYGTAYNIKTTDELIAQKTKQTNITNNISSNAVETIVPSANKRFKDKLDNLYPVCKQCIIDNGYDLDCIRNNSLDCKDANINFCASCQKECEVYCSGYYGDTVNQHNNISQLFSHPIYTKNYDLAKGTTFDNADLYNGNILVNGNGLVGVLDPLLTTLDQSRLLTNGGAELNDFFGPEPEYPATIPAPNQAPGGSGLKSSVNSFIVPEIGPGENGPINEDGLQGKPWQCGVCPVNGGSPGAAPLYFIYRYTGCHMVWYPPEYIFNYQTKIAQGSGWKKTQSENFSGLKTCDFLLSYSGYPADGSDGTPCLSCTSNYVVGGCPTGLACTCRDRTTYPCQCMRYPHLSGGLVDTARKYFNVSQRVQQGGYIPSQEPFAPPMSVSEAGCCSCVNTSNPTTDACYGGLDARRNARAAWPKASGFGKSPPTLGSYCNIGTQGENANTPYFNPNYNKQCFERGISPYLSRISQKLYPAARDVFHYGSTVAKEQEVLGPFYSPTIISPSKYGWNNASFKKTFNKKSNLFHKMVGLIGMDHHFESWAYHSKALFTPAPPIPMNHCNMLITPYERPYAGRWTKSSFIYDPREAFRYQAMRSFPRRVIYGSSVVPLFHSDLHAMEKISVAKNILINGNFFSGEDFIEKFYLYFYNKITDPGETIYNEPVVEPADVTDYEYVTAWLKEMIRYNVISVKDHAGDIATELIELLDSVELEPIDPEHPPADGRPDPVFLDADVEAFLGKKTGYYEMISWLKGKILADNPEANFSDKDDFTIWAALKPYVTAKLMKNNLINPRQENLVSGIPGPMFAGPRRAKLWPTPIGAGLTTWGCTGAGICDTKESVLNVKTNQDPDDLLAYTSLFGGQQTWFAVTTNGKVRAFGRGSVPPSGDPADVGCSPEYANIQVDVEPPCLPPDVPIVCDGNYFDTDVGAVPCHLSVAPELAIIYEEENQNFTLPDGRVEKISSKGKFAVALVEYTEGVVPGPNLWHVNPGCNEINYRRKKFSNSGWEIVGTPYSIFPSGSFNCADPNSNGMYTLKAWGKGNGGGDDAEIDYGIFYDDTRYISDYIQANCPPVNQFRYDLNNKFFIWKDVACGAKHTIAITSGGSLFATPTSDNTYNQSSYGYPTISGKRELAEKRGTQQLAYPNGYQALFYYYHLPKPGYFTEDEWNTLIQRNSSQSLPENKQWWNVTHCINQNQPVGDVSWSEGENAIPCDIRCQLFRQSIDGGNLLGGSKNSCGAEWGYSCIKAIEPDFPVYTQVAAGHYHSIALSDDNNLKIWGSYVKVNEDGEPLSEENSFTNNNPIPVFLPTGEIFPDRWDLGPAGGVTGCSDPNTNNSETDHSSYKVYTTADKTIFSSASIFAIDGGPDYSILARKAGDKHRLVVWGNSEMVTAVSGVTYSGLTAFYAKNYDKIDKITAGPNAIGVVYRKKNSSKKRMDIFPRPDVDRGLTAGIGKNDYSDVSFTYGSVSTIFSSGTKAQTWTASSFDVDHSKLQFKNFGDLPLYFRTQAFFRAVPGRWDFSKWFFGMPCNFIKSEVPLNVVGDIDYTSVYYTKTNDLNRSYSGHPQYYWMRPDWRRIQQATPLHTYEPYPGKGCGMLRDRDGRDGLRPNGENGNGGDPNSSIATANRNLNNEFGACFGGDICWIGDGSPSAFAFSSFGFTPGRGTPFCKCNDLICGCPPSRRDKQAYDCTGGPWISKRCFGYVNGRIGFNSNKDYFIQSAKGFGIVSNDNRDTGLSQCCGVVKTNITGFFYAKRNYYYGYNAETSLYEVQTAPIPYRNHYVGNKYPVPSGVYGMTSSELINELMTPKNSIPKAYNVESTMSYPYVYVGGKTLYKLKKHLSQSVVGTPCNICKVVPNDDPCRTENPCGSGNGAATCQSSVENLVGPGGWAHSYGRKFCTDASPPISINGFMNDSINGSFNKILYMDAAKTDDWLGPLVSFTGYTGPLPPGMTFACNCWCGDRSSFASSAGGCCDCPRDLYPTGSCPNNDRSCPGCKFCCVLNRNLIYRVDKEYSLDDPINYYPSTKPLPGMGTEAEEPVPISGIPRLWRIYDDVYSDYSSLNCGGLTVGTAICFIGMEGQTESGPFEAECVPNGDGVPQPLGKTANMQCSVIEE